MMVPDKHSILPIIYQFDAMIYRNCIRDVKQVAEIQNLAKSKFSN